MITATPGPALDVAARLTPVAPEQCVEAWHLARKDTPGFRESVLKGPHGDVVQLEVSSWTQVPYVLEKLQSSSVRLVFPASADPVVTSEQAAIKEFLRASHSKHVQTLLKDLADRLDAAPSFVPSELPPPGSVTCAAQWIAAHRLSLVSQRCLRTSEVVQAPVDLEPARAEFREAAAAALSSGRPVIVEIPERAQSEPIAEVLREACAGLSNLDAVHERVVVWLPDPASPGSWLEECSLKPFLEQFAGGSSSGGQPTPPPVEEAPAEDLSPPGPEFDNPTTGNTEPSDSPLLDEKASTGEDEAIVLHAIEDSFEEQIDFEALDAYMSEIGRHEPVSDPNEAADPKMSEHQVVHPDLLEEEMSQISASRLSKVSQAVSARFGDIKESTRHLGKFFEKRLPPEVPWPVDKHTSVVRYADGVREQVTVEPGRATQILKECSTRSLEDTAQMLFDAHLHLCEAFSEEEVSGTSVQKNLLVTLPDKGDAIFVSDLEGDVAKLAMLIDQYNLIERWERGEPVFLCVQGDMIDRSTTGSLLVEFLLELKVRRGFSRQVIVLPGNHELSLELNFNGTEYWADRKAPFIGDLFGRDFAPHADTGRGSAVVERLQSLCPAAVLAAERLSPTIDEDSYRARWGLYTLFRGIFQALPRCIVSRNGLFASHAGFPMRGPLAELFQQGSPATKDASYYRSALEWQIFDDSSDGSSLGDLVWNDLDVDLGNDGAFVGLDDPKRLDAGGRNRFSLADFKRFCAGTGTSLMIRGHQSHAPTGSSVPAPVELLQEREAFSGSGPWVAGDVVTVMPHATWSALLDLSTQQPTSKDVQWVGLMSKGATAKAAKHSNGRFLPSAAPKDLLMVLPRLSQDSTAP